MTTGKRWLVIDKHGHEEQFEETDGPRLIERLKPMIGKGNVLNPLNEGFVWEYAINPSRFVAQASVV